MTVVREEDATTHEVHGSTFQSYVTSSSGSRLCAWQLVVPPGVAGVAHRPDQDEILRILNGSMQATVNGTAATLVAGDVLLVQAGDELRVDTLGEGATAWVTTSAGLTATMPDGTVMAPPWAQ